MYLGVPIDRPVDPFDKKRILLVTTFENVVPIGIRRKELGDLVSRKALELSGAWCILATLLSGGVCMIAEGAEFSLLALCLWY